MSEWLRRWTRNPLGSARRGSNPLGVASSFILFYVREIATGARGGYQCTGSLSSVVRACGC